MGPNSKRNQERAAERRNDSVPSRARFSKGPPPKKTTAGGGRGRGRDGNDETGRGGDGRVGRPPSFGRGGGAGGNDDAVVRKIAIQQRQRRMDLGGASTPGGISIVRRRGKPPGSIDSVTTSIGAARNVKSPIDGMDVSKLDEITLSVESMAMVERLLRACNVWEDTEEYDNDNGVYDDDEEKIEVDNDLLGEKGEYDYYETRSNIMNNNNNNNQDDRISSHTDSRYRYRSRIPIGSNVYVIQKDDQRNAKETRGVVSRHLTNNEYHPRGIKVMLVDGTVGRVSRLVAVPSSLTEEVPGDETPYDDYHGDYDDEPDYNRCHDDITITFNHDVDDCDEDESGGSDINVDTEDKGNGNALLAKKEKEMLMNTPIYKHLTQHFSFLENEAILALGASRRRLRVMKRRAEAEAKSNNGGHIKEDSTVSANENEGAILEMAMDWLSLHLEESELRRGFRVQRKSAGGPMRAGALASIRDDGSSLFPIKAVPHESISVMPKLTREQLEKENEELAIKTKKQDLTMDLIRMGFHSKEVEHAFMNMPIDDLLRAGSHEDDVDLSMNGELLKHLIACVELEHDGELDVALDPVINKEMREAARIERDQEKDALEAIYAEGFQILGNTSQDPDILHFRVEVNPPTPLKHPACHDKSHLHVLTRDGYPILSTPMSWFTNTTMPPTLLRRISIHLKNKQKELIGQAVVFDMMESLSENLELWQKQFMDEEKALTEEEVNGLGDGDESDDDEIDYYAHFTAEERKKLSRRQRQKLRAVEKAHSHNAVLVERQQIKLQKEEERRERVKFENETIRVRAAEKTVDKRWKEWVEEEAEKVARKAMNDAFLRGDGRDSARDAAEIARMDMLRFHGEVDEVDDTNLQSLSQNKYTEDDSRTAVNIIHQKIELKDETIAYSDGLLLQQPLITSEATPKTLLFVEKLRRMYEEKAKEKAGIHLADATIKTASDVNESVQNHVPTPVVTPLPGIEEVLQDVLTIQKEQPWLISPEARVPTIDTDVSGTEVDEVRKAETSNALRRELDQKYSQIEQSTKGNGRQRHKQYNVDSARRFQQMLAQRSKLPAYKIRDQLLSAICQNQVTVISGDTGCGKTTQVPQLVLDDLIMKNRGAEANIIVTQPRRISAIGVSERIAAERCEKIGETVGYSIRLESKKSNKTRLLLCTTGILLRRLQCDPDLASVSHIFVDEVHERDLNTDFLLIILKNLLQRRKSLKLILMSATLNADRFSAYFGGCPTVSISGRAQPVKEYRLEDALQMTGHLITQRSDCAKKAKDESLTKSELKRLYPKFDQSVIDSLFVVDESITNYELLAELLQYICTNLEDGAILVFLSGMKEINTAIEALLKIPYFQDSSNVIIHPLHSSLSNAEQTAIFQIPPNGKRKIVISTNIAETSITIDDVVFVVDTGRVKENRYDNLNQMPTLTECWASKASAKQRRGRAGRVKPGYCWHMFSTHTHDKVLDDYQLPEIMRVGLEDLVLQILLLDLGEPSHFLGMAVDPPPVLAVKNALQLLESLGAAECNWGTNINGGSTGMDSTISTSLTALGYHLASLPVHPRVGKLLIYGALFGVSDCSSTIAAAMTSRSPFMSSYDSRDAADEAKRGFASDDHIAVLLAFNQWRELRHSDGRQAKAFLRDHFLSYIFLSNIVQLKKQLEKYMSDIGFKSLLHNGYNKREGEDLHLVRAVITAGLYPNIIIAPKSFSGKAAGEIAFRGRKHNEIYLHPSTIAFTAKELVSRYGCYHEIMKTSKIYIRDVTAVSKFAILLFGGDLKVYQTHGVCSVDDWLKFKIGAKPATLIKHLRVQLEALLLEKIMDPSIDVAESQKGRAVIDAVTTLLKMEACNDK